MIIVGHRGAKNEAPENTLPSFEHAFRNGCMHFELDVQLSKDQQLVTFHDRTLKRTTGKRGKVADYSQAELAAIDARLHTPGWPHPCTIPSLEQLLIQLPEVKHWQFEVKTDSRLKLSIIAQKLVELIKRYQMYDRATLTSSDRSFLKIARSCCPRVSLGLVAESRWYDPVDAAKKLDCEYLCISDHLAKPKRIAKAHEQGLKVSVWTINSLERMQELDEIGVYSIITDLPTMAVEYWARDESDAGRQASDA